MSEIGVCGPCSKSEIVKFSSTGLEIEEGPFVTGSNGFHSIRQSSDIARRVSVQYLTVITLDCWSC